MSSSSFESEPIPGPPRADETPEAAATANSPGPVALGLLGLAYFTTGWLGLQAPQIGEHITLLWPPTGIALFGFYRFGPSVWPAIAFAAFTLNLVIGGPLGSAVGIAAGNTLAPLIAAHLIKARPAPHPPAGIVATVRFVTFAAGSMLVSATVGSFSLVAAGVVERESVLQAIAGWWAGDALGAVVVGGLLLSIQPSTWPVLRTPRGLSRYLLCSVAVGATSAAAFYGDGLLPFAFLTLLVLAVISVTEPGFTSGSALITGAVVTVLATAQGIGTFGGESASSSMPVVLSYVAALAAMRILVHAAVRDHEALGESEKRNRHLLEAGPDALFLVSSEGQIVDLNESACRAFGMTREALLGRPASIVNARAGQEAIVEQIRRVIEKGAITFETELHGSAGSPVPVDIHMSPYRIGEVDYVIASARDISRRKEAERRRREHEMRLQAIYEHEPECVKTLDRECRLLDMNPAGLRLIAAKTIDEVRGIDTRELIAPEYRQAFEQGVRDVFDGKTTFQVFVMIGLDGTRRWMEQHAAPLPAADGSGRVQEMLAVTRDISDRKEAERRLLQTQRVEALGSLAGGIAHDLNNTLSPVLLSLDELYERVGPGDPVVETVERSAERAVDMIRHLLSFARGAEGERTDVDPFVLLQEIEAIVSATFPKTIAFAIDAPDSLPMLRADATQLHQVFLNLCVNARDAMPEGGDLRIRVTTDHLVPGDLGGEEVPALTSSGRFVVFDVEDSGGGIPEKIRAQIFEPFFSTKRLNEGTGLGLASASGIVGNHGGAIRVGASAAGGALFSVYLPALDRVSHAPISKGPGRQQSPDGAIASRSPERRAREGRVLLVDDEVSVRSVAAQALERLGYEVHAAGDAAEALALFDQIAPVDVIVSDLRMPGMGGDELIRTLRRKDPTLAAILTSGHMEAAAAPLPAKGNARVIVRLEKPYRLKALRVALERARETQSTSAG